MLEAAEGGMGSTEQNLEMVMVKDLHYPLLPAVGSRLVAPLPPIPSLFKSSPNIISRLARQKGKDVNSRVIVRRLACCNKETAFAMSSVLQHCQKVDLLGLGQMAVEGDLGVEGWAALREALSCRLHDVPHLDTHLKINLASARKEDLRAIWECLSLSWKSSGDQLKFMKQRGEEG